MKNVVCMFCGHRNVTDKEKMKKIVTEIIIDLIENKGVDVFLCGGMGDFDDICSQCVGDLKVRYHHIKQYLIIPYMTRKFEESSYKYFMFNDVIKPDLGNVHPKAAIVKRNQWMVDKSEYIVAFVQREFGGAFNTLKYGIEEGKKIVRV